VSTKRIAFVVGTLNTGGIEKMVSDLSLSLREKGWYVLVVCISHRKGKFLDQLLANGVQVEECSIKKSFFAFRFAQLLRQNKVEVVHSHVAFSMPWQVMGSRMAGITNIIFTQQNEYQNWSNNWIRRIRYKLYFVLFFRFISSYTCVSFSVRKSLSPLTGVPENNFLVIPNAVDLKAFVSDENLRKQQRAAMDISPNTKLVGIVARFAPQKGHNILLEAFATVTRRVPDVRLLLIGSGDLEQSLRTQSKTLGIENQVIFFGNTLEINAMLNAMDVFILSSWWEGFGICLIEAMAVGLPIVTTRVAGVCNFIPPGEIFRVVEPGDAEAMSEQLISLLEKPVEREQRTRQIQSAKDNFRMENIVAQYVILYNKK